MKIRYPWKRSNGKTERSGQIDEKGTKAAAVTVVEMNDECAAVIPEDYKTVILDRPFLYMLIDTETNMPFFIGTVADAGA